MPGRVVCPVCRNKDQVEKVSTIYLVSIGLKGEAQEAGNLARGMSKPLALPHLGDIDPTSLRALGRRLAPPSSRKNGLMRPVHPDLVVFFFSLFLPIFLYGIYTTQPGVLLPGMLVLAGGYGLYIWKRRMLVNKFERQRADQLAQESRIRESMKLWMNLYYCIRDDSVFVLGSDQFAPADQIASLYLGNDRPR